MSRSIETALSAVVSIFVLSTTVLVASCGEAPAPEKSGLEKLKEGREAFQTEQDKERDDLKAYLVERCEQRNWLLGEGLGCEELAENLLLELDKMIKQQPPKAEAAPVPPEKPKPVEVVPAPAPVQVIVVPVPAAEPKPEETKPDLAPTPAPVPVSEPKAEVLETLEASVVYSHSGDGKYVFAYEPPQGEGMDCRYLSGQPRDWLMACVIFEGDEAWWRCNSCSKSEEDSLVLNCTCSKVAGPAE